MRASSTYVAAFYALLTAGCASAAWRAASYRPVLLLVDAQERGLDDVAVRGPHGGVLGRWQPPSDDGEDGPSEIAGLGWYFGPGPYTLVLTWRWSSDGRSVDVPLTLDGTEVAVHVELTRAAVAVSLLSASPEVTLRRTEGTPFSFEIRNDGPLAIRGHGVPRGLFDGHLVELAPRMGLFRRPRHCGTGVFDPAPLWPGASDRSEPSDFAIGDRRRHVDEGQFVWIVPLSEDGRPPDARTFTVGDRRVHVARFHAVVARFTLP